MYPVPAGIHSPETITETFNESLRQLRTSSVDIFYLHAADRSVPFTSTLYAVNTLFQEGKFKQLGLSNFTAFEVAEVVVTCKERGWIRPTIYQGMYNAISKFTRIEKQKTKQSYDFFLIYHTARLIEPELVVACRRYGLDIVAFNPLAGGFFTGKYKSTTTGPSLAIPDGDLKATAAANSSIGSLSANTSVGKIYRSRYFKDAYFQALELIEPAITSHSLTLVEVALRWLVHHSALNIVDGNDGTIIGASTVEQLRGNLLDMEKGPLPREVLDVLDEAWEITRSHAPTYWHLDLKYTYDFDDD